MPARNDPAHRQAAAVILAWVHDIDVDVAMKGASQAQPTALPTQVHQEPSQSKPVNQESTQPKPQHTTTDTVHISNAGLAAVQEATETHAQTVNEASHGDTQAQRLLAKEAAAKATAK